MISITRYAALARCLSVVVLASLLTAPARAAESAAAGGWDLSLEPYAWLPTLEAATPGGAEIDLGLSDILEALNWMTMVQGTAKKDKWTVFGDAINLKLTQSGNDTFKVPVGPFTPTLSTDGKYVLKAWVITGGVDYELIRTDKYSVGGFVGARSLWLDVVLTETTTVRRLSGSAREAGSGWNVDGIVGMQGRYTLDHKSFLRWYGDVGTGDSNLTWSAVGDVVYKFKRFEAFGGYRYMTWDLGDNEALSDLTVMGPRIGAIFRF
jgi:hypothetical protein